MNADSYINGSEFQSGFDALTDECSPGAFEYEPEPAITETVKLTVTYERVVRTGTYETHESATIEVTIDTYSDGLVTATGDDLFLRARKGTGLMKGFGAAGPQQAVRRALLSEGFIQ